jgi:predicted transcriptional regulator
LGKGSRTDAGWSICQLAGAQTVALKAKHLPGKESYSMTITLELEPEVEARVRTAAERRGQTASAFLQDVAAILPADPVRLAMLLAPEDDEPLTEEDCAAIKATLDDVAHGRGISTDELRSRLAGTSV